MSSMLNREVGQRYIVREFLGEGAHARVYRATDSVRKGEVALKLFKDDALDAQTAEAARQFEVAEGSAILPLLEVHPEFAEGQVTVMPLMPGTLASRDTFFASEAVHYTRRILTGLEFCHGRGVIHGDVKRSNAFLSPNGAVLLGDFGVADVLPDGSRGFTLEYAAPELLGGAPRSDASDIWAAAVTFYELLCGELPFGQRGDLTEDEVAGRIAAGDYMHPDERLPYLPLRFREFFRGCFAVDPAQRSESTAGGMRNALRELAVHVEWVRTAEAGCVCCFEGHQVTPDGHQTGVLYQATVRERPRAGDHVAEVKRCQPGGSYRRLVRLEPFHGSAAQAAQKLSVWMRTITDNGDITR